MTTKQFIEKARAVHGEKYDYTKVNYINNHTKIIIICPKHGEFTQRGSGHLQGYGCKECRKEKLSYTTEQFIEKAKQVHGDKYDYSKVEYKHSQSKVIITCKKHGDFEQNPTNHILGGNCSVCVYEDRKLSLKQFIEKARVIHNNKYSYNNFIYINAKTKGYITCPEHGDFEQIPNSHLGGSGCPNCNSSKGELVIKTILDKYNIEAKQEWKFPDEKYLYEYDFYLPDYNLLIEFHGIQHYEFIPYFHETLDIFKKRQEDDLFKKSLAWDKRIPLLEFNHKQLKHMTDEQFEELVIRNINIKSSKVCNDRNTFRSSPLLKGMG